MCHWCQTQADVPSGRCAWAAWRTRYPGDEVVSDPTDQSPVDVSDPTAAIYSRSTSGRSTSGRAPVEVSDPTAAIHSRSTSGRAPVDVSDPTAAIYSRSTSGQAPVDVSEPLPTGRARVDVSDPTAGIGGRHGSLLPATAAGAGQRKLEPATGRIGAARGWVGENPSGDSGERAGALGGDGSRVVGMPWSVRLVWAHHRRPQRPSHGRPCRGLCGSSSRHLQSVTVGANSYFFVDLSHQPNVRRAESINIEY